MKHTNEGYSCPSCDEKLGKAHSLLQAWFCNYVKPAYKNVHISWAYRDEVSQEQAFNEGKSRLHYPNSAHNKQPAEALDLFILDDQGLAKFPPSAYSEIADKLDVSVMIWGGTFQKLKDLDHFELKRS